MLKYFDTHAATGTRIPADLSTGEVNSLVNLK